MTDAEIAEAQQQARCSVAECNRLHHGQGYCKLHGRRLRERGDVGAGVQPRKMIFGTPEERFWAYVTVKEGCWEWTGYTFRGYGMFTETQIPEGAHRVSYRWFVGPIGTDLTIDHLCFNRACVRPDHLEMVTMAENVIRGHKAREGMRIPRNRKTRAERDRLAREVLEVKA